MTLVVCDPEQAARMIAKRKAMGHDRFDEVWDGVYIMSPLADDEHQDIVGKLVSVMQDVVGWSGAGQVRPGVNVSDRDKGWKKNYRCPDVTVFLPGCAAVNRRTHWLGGPDWAAEIMSEGDRSRQKLDFYAKVGTRELLLVDRHPWALELYALKRRKLRLVGRSTPEGSEVLVSSVLPLSFGLVAGKTRPSVEVVQTDTERRWLV